MKIFKLPNEGKYKYNTNIWSGICKYEEKFKYLSYTGTVPPFFLLASYVNSP
jgi:hypothetical protein